MNDLREKANLKRAKNQLTLLIIKKLCSKCNALLRKQYLGFLQSMQFWLINKFEANSKSSFKEKISKQTFLFA